MGLLRREEKTAEGTKDRRGIKGYDSWYAISLSSLNFFLHCQHYWFPHLVNIFFLLFLKTPSLNSPITSSFPFPIAIPFSLFIHPSLPSSIILSTQLFLLIFSSSTIETAPFLNLVGPIFHQPNTNANANRLWSFQNQTCLLFSNTNT